MNMVFILTLVSLLEGLDLVWAQSGFLLSFVSILDKEETGFMCFLIHVLKPLLWVKIKPLQYLFRESLASSSTHSLVLVMTWSWGRWS